RPARRGEGGARAYHRRPPPRRGPRWDPPPSPARARGGGGGGRRGGGGGGGRGGGGRGWGGVRAGGGGAETLRGSARRSRGWCARGTVGRGRQRGEVGALLRDLRGANARPRVSGARSPILPRCLGCFRSPRSDRSGTEGRHAGGRPGCARLQRPSRGALGLVSEGVPVVVPQYAPVLGSPPHG